MSKRSKACEISKQVKETVFMRDKGKCIICSSTYALPNAHYIRRSQGGLGIPENVVTLCIDCHHEFDNGSKREEYGELIKNYLEKHYKDWNKEKLIYKKW